MVDFINDRGGLGFFHHLLFFHQTGSPEELFDPFAFSIAQHTDH